MFFASVRYGSGIPSRELPRNQLPRSFTPEAFTPDGVDLLIIMASTSPETMLDSGTTTPPALRMPKISTMESTVLVVSRATLSPFASPNRIRPLAVRLTC